MRFSRIAAVVMTVSFAAVVGGCAPATISSFTERSVSFADYATFGWSPAAAQPTGDPRLDNNPFFADRLRVEVERQLVRRGYLRTHDAEPDLIVSAYVSLREEVNTNGVERQPVNTRHGSPEPYVFEAGTLWIDVVDRRTSKLLWRGWAEGSIEGVVDNQAWMEQKIDELVARILEALPGRS